MKSISNCFLNPYYLLFYPLSYWIHGKTLLTFSMITALGLKINDSNQWKYLKDKEYFFFQTNGLNNLTGYGNSQDYNKI